MIRIFTYRMIAALSVLVSMHNITWASDAGERAVYTVRMYYKYLRLYASDPSKIETYDKIKGLFIDGKGSVYNDIHTMIYGNPETESDVTSYIASVGAYKNKSGGFPLGISVDERELRYQTDGSATYVYVSKRVSCGLGAMPTDYIVREVALVQADKIVRISKESEDERESRSYMNENQKGGSVEDISLYSVDDDLVAKIRFTISGMQGRYCNVSCYFYDDRGYPLKDHNSNFCTTNGMVATSTSICPPYENTRYNGLEITIPISELHLNTSRPMVLQIMIVVWYNDEEIFRSPITGFRFI